ncbi:MAG: translation initiation factor IF-2 [Akkermansiaceae bacterium]|jgi:translation initiation factor IF-2|nr:translation initiation factor IF-2 [Akkermansiaceae bacterium]
MPSNSIPEESDQKDDKEQSDDAKSIDKSLSASDDNGKEALSLFEEQEKREARKGRKKELEAKPEKVGGILPPISKLIDAEVQEDTPKGDGADDDIDDAKVIHIKPPIILKDLADKMGIKPFNIIKDLMALDVFASLDSSIAPEVAATICDNHGFLFEKEKREKGGGVHKVEEVFEEPPPPEPEAQGEDELPFRPPVVTVMGHVDHGKTSILDAIRSSRVAAGEAGGITQHINAYSVEHDGANITFIDTPGHAAFTEMRARGADITDIVVLVVAADDGIMPTTHEAISHARAAGVTIIVAINKIDLPGADVNKVISQLQENDLTPEDWGGETICVQTSATEGLGVDDLLGMIALQSEVMELRANPEGAARGIVIEASSKAGKGSTASVIVRTGNLNIGDSFICGPYFGKVKLILDDFGNQLKEAGPSMPVEVLGFSGVPKVGDELVVMDSERAVKKLSEERLEELRQEKLMKPHKARLQDIWAEVGSTKKTLKIVLKGDVQGSIQAIESSLMEIKSEKIDIEILHKAAGPISESDVLLCSASDGIIIGFGVKVENKALRLGKQEGVEIRLYSIIYELIDQIKEAMLGMLDTQTREKLLGRAEVKEIFKIKRGRVGGCIVNEGQISRKARARVIRQGQSVYDGGFQTLRRFQDDADIVKTGLECGIRLGNYLEYEVGDIIECYELEKVEQTL